MQGIEVDTSGKTNFKERAAAFAFPVPNAGKKFQLAFGHGHGEKVAYMVQQLYRHLDVSRLTCDHDQPLVLATTRAGGAIRANSHSAWLHDFDLTRTHVSNLVYFAASFANDAPYKIVGDINLLGL